MHLRHFPRALLLALAPRQARWAYPTALGPWARGAAGVAGLACSLVSGLAGLSPATRTPPPAETTLIPTTSAPTEVPAATQPLPPADTAQPAATPSSPPTAVALASTLAPAGPAISPDNWDDLGTLAATDFFVGGASGTLDGLAWSPEGRTFAVSFRIVHLFDAVSLEQVYPLSSGGEWNATGGVAFSPDGRLLASGEYGPNVFLADAADRRPLAPLQRSSSGWVLSVAFSPDGGRLASASEDGEVQVWEVATGDLAWTGAEHPEPVRAIAWSPDGQLIASAGDDATVRLWDASDGDSLRALEHEAAVTDVAFSPAGDVLLTASRHVQLWDHQSGQLMETFRLKEAAPHVAFNPSGSLFAAGRCAQRAEDAPFTCAEEGEILLWETESRTFLGTLRGHEGVNVLVAFSPDGSRLLSVSDDATMRLWAVSP